MTLNLNPSPELREARNRLSHHEQMLDAQAGCLPCKLCGGKAVVTDAGSGAGYYVACGNSVSFRDSKGCLINERRLGGWAYNVMEWWNRLHAQTLPAPGEVELREAFSGVMRAEVVDAGAWSLHLHFGRGDGARDRMRAASSLLASNASATPTLARVARIGHDVDCGLLYDDGPEECTREPDPLRKAAKAIIGKLEDSEASFARNVANLPDEPPIGDDDGVCISVGDLRALRTALATVAAANDEGDWVLVPREITQAMLDATCATDADDRAMRAAWSELIRTAPNRLAASRSQHEGASS